MNYEFKRVYRRGSLKAGRYLVLYTLKNRYENNRLGITTSKKVGKSVKRNKARRLMKEIYRIYKDQLEIGYDIIFIARKNMESASFVELETTTERLLKRIKLLIGEEI
ncbi:MAG: ribonuclease P protein component [Clostridia bacterium]|nr:ribonuclease P protein component [Clostridia bacterium]